MEKEQLQITLEEAFEWFHKHPELSLEEVNTTKQIRKLLQEKDIEILNLPFITAVQLVNSLQTIISRNVDPLDQALISVTSIHGGSTWNVIPTSVRLEGTVRTFKRDTRSFVQKRIEETIGGIAEVSGAEINLTWLPGPPSTNNDAEWTAFARETAKEEQLIVKELPPSLGGEDFAFYQEKIRGAFINIGIGKTYPLHHPKFAVDKSALSKSAKLFSELAQKALLKISREENHDSVR